MKQNGLNRQKAKADWYDPNVAFEYTIFGKREYEESDERKSPKNTGITIGNVAEC